ncbi:MAG: Lrp/AsnC family transcriptional regulator [Oscillospiraceae bacterium]|nr:Lrp/AsnC family transcriptional regulator [Oscillospiraceae bacterium]
MKELLQLLKQNARLSNAELAAMLGRDEATVARQITELEETGVIRGYSVIVDEELADKDEVSAYIELKVTPQPDCGFDELARMISTFESVESVTLMSGGYDLGITITGTGLRDIASFVAQRLATLNGVLSTRTHFVLKRYKEKGILIQDEISDERGVYL